MSEWMSVSDIEADIELQDIVPDEIQSFAQVVGDIPDEHVITVAERRVSVDYPTIIQNNMNTDTVDLVLDGEWDGMSVVCYIGHPGDLGEFEWKGKPFTLPVYDMTGPIDVTVVGLSADGKTRLVTAEAEGIMDVIKSGEFEGSIPHEDQPDLLSQILEAKGEAEDAAEAANNAATSATSAASSANTAASSANSAASSANSAATKATSAAVNAENAYDTLQPYMATIDSCANILHREVGPDAVVTADDSFPAKPVEMVVYGNTVQNLWVNPSGTNNGVTVTSNADGSITLSGTPNVDGSSPTLSSDIIYTLKPNTTYIAFSDKAVSDAYESNHGACFYITQYQTDGTYISDKIFAFTGNLSVVFTTDSSFGYARCRITVRPNTTVSGTYRVMLNEGSTAEPWCPPGLNSVGDGGSVDIVTAGKNLVSISESSAANFQLVDYFLPAGEYTMSIGDKPDGFAFNIRAPRGLGVGTSDDNVLANVSSSVSTFTLDYASPLHINGYSTPATPLKNIQLELGSTATSYEPPSITTTSVDLQGHTLNAMPDGTRDELHIDGGGNVVLEKRCGVATAPTAAGSWKWETAMGGIASFTLPAKSTGTQTDMTELMRCDKLPVRQASGVASYAIVGTTQGHAKNPAITSTATAATVAGGATYIYQLAEPQTIDLGTITPSTMAAPNVTAYVADDTPAEMGLDYVRDINIVVDRLEKKVADLVVTEATIV